LYNLGCSLCGVYLETRKDLYLINGKVNPNYLVVGHIVPRVECYAFGWTIEQTESIENTRPECWRCSQRGGAKLGNRIQFRQRQQRQGQRRAQKMIKPEPPKQWKYESRW
jgi:hypothetical protein